MAQAMIDYQKEKEKKKIQEKVKEKSDMEKFIGTFCIAESHQDPNFFLGEKRNHNTVAQK